LLSCTGAISSRNPVTASRGGVYVEGINRPMPMPSQPAATRDNAPTNAIGIQPAWK
jgi:hypothetical protein